MEYGRIRWKKWNTFDSRLRPKKDRTEFKDQVESLLWTKDRIFKKY